MFWLGQYMLSLIFKTRTFICRHKSIMSIKDKILQKQSCKLLQHQSKAQHDI